MSETHGPETGAGLEMPAEVMRELGYRVVDMLVDRYAAAGGTIPWQGASRAELDGRLRRPAPEGPAPFDDVLHRLATDVLPYGARVDHPRFMAFVPGAPVWPAVLGDLIAAGTNVFQGTWLASSGTSALELVVIDWFRSWLGCPDDAAGLLVSGGSAANLTALACARSARFASHPAAAVIYCSAETHSSIARAARVLGFAADRVRQIAVDDADRIDMHQLRQAVAADRAADLVPFLVVGNAGTTSTGAVDPLHELADFCAHEGLWLHIDAAYGGFAVLTDRGAEALSGIGRGDSVTLDPHKWLYQPFEAGCLIVRDAALLEHAFHVMPPYLQDTALPGTAAGPGAAGALPVNFANRGIQLTRSARVFKIWISLQTHGLAAFRSAIDGCMDLALHAERIIRESTELELLSPARLGIVCFRRRAGGGMDADELNRLLLLELLESGAGMISSTRVRGCFALRICVLNYRSTAADVERIIRWIEAYEGSLNT